MAFGAQIAIVAAPTDVTVDPQDGTKQVGPANAIEVADGPTPCTLVFECEGNGIKRTFTNLAPGKNWAGMTITKVYGADDGTTATSVRLRWGAAT